MSKDTTHFGYETVAVEEKAERVRGVFDSVAGNYDLMNDLMSGGLHRLWKRYTIDQAGARRGDVVLDLAGGTGDLARRFAGQVGVGLKHHVNRAVIGLDRLHVFPVSLNFFTTFQTVSRRIWSFLAIKELLSPFL